MVKSTDISLDDAQEDHEPPWQSPNAIGVNFGAVQAAYYQNGLNENLPFRYVEDSMKILSQAGSARSGFHSIGRAMSGAGRNSTVTCFTFWNMPASTTCKLSSITITGKRAAGLDVVLAFPILSCRSVIPRSVLGNQTMIMSETFGFDFGTGRPETLRAVMCGNGRSNFSKKLLLLQGTIRPSLPTKY
jgi:hypothetical protein